MTPLMIAVGMRSTAGRGGPGGGDPTRTIRMVDSLLDAGANVNAQVTGSRNHSGTIMAYVAGRDQEGKTALMSAAEGGNTAVVEHLLSRGADPMIKDAEGKTALDFAKPPPPPPAAEGETAAAAGQAQGQGQAAGAAPARGAGPPAASREQLVKVLEAAMAKAGG
jgi:hypothetical protein